MRALKIGFALIGVIVGAGFASGQEILQYFTSFGMLGIAGAVLATALFAYLGMMLTSVGSRLKVDSHKEAIYTISGPYLGIVVDAVIVFTLFGVGVVMIAGAGSTLNQQFGLPTFIGSLIIVIIIALAMMLKLDKVLSVIASITPFLLLFIIIISVYSFLSLEGSFTELEAVAQTTPDYFPNWFIAAINYVSFNIAVGAGMALITGGAESNPRVAKWGGLLGGLGIGLMIILAHLAIFSRISTVKDVDLPLLKIVEEISPHLAIVMALILFGMIFNTGLGMFYGFVSRFFEMNTKRANLVAIITLVIAFILSFVGFTDLVSKVYKFIGFIGLVLMAVLIYAPVRLRKLGK